MKTVLSFIWLFFEYVIAMILVLGFILGAIYVYDNPILKADNLDFVSNAVVDILLFLLVIGVIFYSKKSTKVE